MSKEFSKIKSKNKLSNPHEVKDALSLFDFLDYQYKIYALIMANYLMDKQKQQS